MDEEYISKNCPKLDSLISEVLQLYATSGLMREAVAPTAVGGKILEANSMVLVSCRNTQPDTCSNECSSLGPIP